MDQLFNRTTYACSRIITQMYSTSFSLGIRSLHTKLRAPIYGIYGFVRYADEIVDTFHEQDKKQLLDEFRQDTYQAIERGVSLNPVLHAFQDVVRTYHIEKELIEAFLHSMEMDLYKSAYSKEHYGTYIYGSAEVVGLMCLRVFLEGDQQAYEQLKPMARSLGAAFQKVNFLRDIRSDYYERGRVYFPNTDFNQFTVQDKQAIEADIAQDFDHAREGIRQLPNTARWGVYLAYIYYLALFRKIRHLPPKAILQARIRIPNSYKLLLLVKTWFRHKLNLI